MNRSKLPFIRPCLPFPDEWLRFLRESYRTRYFSNGGPCVRQFEAELTERYGQGREAIVTASATAGLTAALLAAPIYRRGSVILPAFTFPATANAILAAGHSLRFCDVSPETWELDPDALADTIEAARRAPGPVLCEFIVEMEENVFPMVAAGATNDHILADPLNRKSEVPA